MAPCLVSDKGLFDLKDFYIKIWLIGQKVCVKTLITLDIY